jgi:hypothetical protein
VIFENANLEDAAKIRLCGICGELGVEILRSEVARSLPAYSVSIST